jgi:hypothetical protein
MTRKQKRRIEIINALSELSRDGWSRARFGDYQSLEAELRELSK